MTAERDQLRHSLIELISMLNAEKAKNAALSDALLLINKEAGKLKTALLQFQKQRFH
jgi:hypothetical protein